MLYAVILLSTLLLHNIENARSKLTCRDEDNVESDWYIAYKLPKNSKSDNELIRVGEAYANLVVAKGSWSISKYSVEDKKSSLGSTQSQILKSKTAAYILYNDQMPDGDATSSWGHTKGVLACDGKTGFWLSHSIPRFPNSSAGTYDYPDNAKDNGQSIICITFKAEELPKIIKHMTFTKPKIFENQYTKGLDSQPEEVQNFFNGNPAFVKTEPWKNVDTIKSEDGQQFKIFAKHAKWSQDLYNASVGPELKSSLYVETWMSGSGNKLKSDCDKDPISVLNINSIKLQAGTDTVSFMRTQDHSKWAASHKRTQPWVCIGDINRMESQFKRGGGTICIKSASVWKAYHSSIENYEECPV